MTYELIDNLLLFPASPGDATHLIQNEEQLPTDLKAYLAESPNKMRTTGNWLWQSPTAIKRLATEPGFLMACKYLGMGHYHYLVWNHQSDNWYITTLGAANVHDATSVYNDWKVQKKTGDHIPIGEWMSKFNKEALSNK